MTRSKWPLPDVVDPLDSICFQVKVPNNGYHIRAFLGAIYELSKPYAWQNDSAHTALLAGAVWSKIFDKLLPGCPCPTFPPSGILEDLEMPLRVDCDCNVFVTCCDGTEKQLLTAEQVKALLAGSSVVGAPQPKPGGGQQCYPVSLQANQLWLLPTVVNTGDTILINNAEGANNDGQALSWQCPDGTRYFAGTCGLPVASYGADPLPTANHGQLVLELAGTFYALTPGTPFTVPGGIANQSPTIQANLQLSTASGQMSFNVCVTNNATLTWTHTFDFTLSSGGFVPNLDGGGNAQAVWVPGAGWEQTFIPNDGAGIAEMRCRFHRTGITPAFAVTAMTALVNFHAGSTIDPTAGQDFGLFDGGAHFAYTMTPTYSSNGDNQILGGPIAASGITQIFFDFYVGLAVTPTNPGGTCLVKSITISGTGTDPF